ncbi:unnamed protein product [Urochloa humidicola]
MRCGCFLLYQTSQPDPRVRDSRSVSSGPPPLSSLRQLSLPLLHRQHTTTAAAALKPAGVRHSHVIGDVPQAPAGVGRMQHQAVRRHRTEEAASSWVPEDLVWRVVPGDLLDYVRFRAGW